MADIGGPAGRPSPQWLQTLANGLVAKVADRGMTLTVAGAEAILIDRIRAVAATLQISERAARAYIGQDDLDGMAGGLAESVADEAPGADLLKLPCDAALRVSGIGRLFAALAQCADFFAAYADIDEALSRARGIEITDLIGILGLVQARHETGDVVFAPRAVFVRISRILGGVADLTSNEDLSLALRGDAIIAKAGAKAHRWPPQS